MKIKILSDNLSICKVEKLDDIVMDSCPLFIAITQEEISVVCNAVNVPRNVIAVEDDWKALKIEGVLDFSLVGILSKIATILADRKISIFSVSTFNTDYILIKEDKLDEAVEVLTSRNYEFI